MTASNVSHLGNQKDISIQMEPYLVLKPFSLLFSFGSKELYASYMQLSMFVKKEAGSKKKLPSINFAY